MPKYVKILSTQEWKDQPRSEWPLPELLAELEAIKLPPECLNVEIEGVGTIRDFHSWRIHHKANLAHGNETAQKAARKRVETLLNHLKP